MNLRRLERIEGTLLRLRLPYDTGVMGVNAASLSAATRRWLLSRFSIENGLEKFQLAGVCGGFLEHLCRAVAMQERITLRNMDCWQLLELRREAAEFADLDTLAEIDSACAPYIRNTLLAPEVLLARKSPPLEWWIEAEPLPQSLAPTRDTVVAVLRDRLSRHLRMWPSWFTIALLDANGSPIYACDPGVAFGTALVRRSS